MFRTKDGWVQEYQRKGALWIHDENPKRPHALLTSGGHSSGFFNSELVAEDTLIHDEACRDLVYLLGEHGLNAKDVDRVVGPAMGAITMADGVSRHVGRADSRSCLRAYTEKETGGDGKLMVFKRTTIHPGERVLFVEDVLTTGGSVELSVAAVAVAGGIALPFVAVLVNRSGLKEVNGKKIVALIDRPMPTWFPSKEKCPLCEQGSEAIRPKTPVENWQRLNDVC